MSSAARRGDWLARRGDGIDRRFAPKGTIVLRARKSGINDSRVEMNASKDDVRGGEWVSDNGLG